MKLDGYMNWQQPIGKCMKPKNKSLTLKSLLVSLLKHAELFIENDDN